MMKELKRIRGLLNTRPAGHGGQSSGAIDRVAAITLHQLGTATPSQTVQAAHS
jgi:hypothetical protein